MITKHDLDEAIMECQGKKDPDANTCIKLAAFFTIRQFLYPDIVNQPGYSAIPNIERSYSYDPAPGIIYTGDSDFAQAVNGRDQLEIFAILDELMETLKVINPGLYASVMRRLKK